MITQPITSFRGPYRFLSNFYIEPDGTHVEGEYQRAKCANAIDQNKFIGLGPAKSKQLGRTVKLRADWEREKENIMRDCLYRKFVEHKSLRTLLLATGDAELIEGNNWGDTIWGECNGIGQNLLGKLLMEVRGELTKL